MKRYLVTMLLALSLTATAMAQATPQAISMVNTNYSSQVESASYNLIVDGVNKTQFISFKVQNNRSMIGLRQFSTVLGATVDWDVEKVATVKKGSTIIEVPIGSPYILVNGSKVAIDNQQTVSIIVDSSTYLPFRVIAESLGYKVTYDNNSKTITCTSSTTQPQQPQKPTTGYPNPYGVTVPQGMENTTWLECYNTLRERYGITHEHVLEILSNIKVAPKHDGSRDANTTTREQMAHFGNVTKDPAYRKLCEFPPKGKGEYEYQYKDGWFWIHGQWSHNDRLYAGLIGVSLGS